MSQEDENDQEPLGEESENSNKAHLNALSDFNRQYNLRNRTMGEAPLKKVVEGQASASQPTKIQPRKEVVHQNPKEKELLKVVPPGDKELPKEIVPKEKDFPKEEVRRDLIKKYVPPFNLQAEISKIKIVFPFNEILRKPEYRGKLSHMIRFEETLDTLNLQDDRPKIVYGPWAQTSLKSEDVPPFYISLTIHDMFMHNAMLDSGASHNLMPKIIMEFLRLNITIPYKDLYSFDSKEVKCLRLIKDLVVSLHQIPEKSLVMDMVVANVLPKFGMLLSRSWAAKLNGTLQMDLSYATIQQTLSMIRLFLA